MYGRFFAGSVRPARNVVAIVLTAGLGTTLALLARVLAPARAPVVGAFPSAAGEPLQRTDPAPASTLARQTGRAVEVLSLRTEYEEHFARPDGTFSFISYASPVRVHRGDGWARLDPTLRRTGSQVIPAATVSDLRFSDGGVGPLATIGKGGRQMSVWWPGPLPTPTISGNTATYANVFLGVDLRMRARDDGYSQMLVVHTREAAANPALRSIQRTSGVGLTFQQGPDGSVAAVDGAGTPAFISPGSIMWDFSGAEERCLCDEPAAGRQTPMPVKVESNQRARRTRPSSPGPARNPVIPCTLRTTEPVDRRPRGSTIAIRNPGNGRFIGMKAWGMRKSRCDSRPSKRSAPTLSSVP